jgi:hypothetical protein
MRLNIDGIVFSATTLCQATILAITLSEKEVGKCASMSIPSANAHVNQQRLEKENTVIQS